MSRRIRRGRRGIDLPVKNPPTSTDRLIGHDASGNMFQTPVDAVAPPPTRTWLHVSSNGTKTAGGTPILTSTRVGTGHYRITAPVGTTVLAAVVTPATSATAGRTCSVFGFSGRVFDVQTGTPAGDGIRADCGFFAMVELN